MSIQSRHCNHVMREAERLGLTDGFHPVIKNISCAISDWHSERDWLFQTDRAMRTIEAIAIELNKEGHKEAANYLYRVLNDNEPKAKSPDLVETTKETKFSTLFF